MHGKTESLSIGFRRTFHEHSLSRRHQHQRIAPHERRRFRFSRFHPIEFYAIFPDEERARRAAGHFRGESLNAQISARDDGAWSLELSRVMYATYDDIGDFEQDFEAVVEPLGGVIEGWGVKQEIRRLQA